jgi:DNA-binding protein H-NS
MLQSKEVGISMLTEIQKRRYEETLDLAKQELELLDSELAAEIARAKQKLQDLQEAKKAVKLIYDGACARLGNKNDLTLQSFDLSELEKHA